MATFATPPSTTLINPTPFKIGVHPTAIDELKTLLKVSKLAKPTYENTTKDKNYGVSREWLEEAVRVWREDFDWHKHEKEINGFPQFTSQVQVAGGMTMRIHFIALFSQKDDAMPLMMLHGWPGSFLEFLPLLSLLRQKYTPQTLPYHVIIPSLPGFAFSDPPPLDRNFDHGDAGEVLHGLMVNLGFGERYVVQGGDVGSKIARVLGVRYAGCKAVHLNYCYGSELENVTGEITEQDRKDVETTKEFIKTGYGYAIEQGTRASTIGLVLSSSPVALLAWIGEKFLSWSETSPDLDTIIESVALYWFTDTISSSFYNYRQAYAPSQPGKHTNPTYYLHKPFGYSHFAKEIAPVPKAWAETTGMLVWYKRHESGGHFAALEKPEVLLRDVEEFVEQVREA